ncbi:hypothetical protein V6N13_084293 [Hibiscus sabdariffa]
MNTPRQNGSKQNEMEPMRELHPEVDLLDRGSCNHWYTSFFHSYCGKIRKHKPDSRETSHIKPNRLQNIKFTKTPFKQAMIIDQATIEHCRGNDHWRRIEKSIQLIGLLSTWTDEAA